MDTPSRRLENFTQKAVISLLPFLSACSIQIGGTRAAEPGAHMSEKDADPFNMADPFDMIEKSSATRDELIRCVLNAPENNEQFTHSVETKLGGTYEKGSFTYDDEKCRSTKVDASVTKHDGSLSRSLEKKVTIWGIDGEEQALEACKKAY